MLRPLLVRSSGMVGLMSLGVCLHSETALAQYYPDAPPPVELPWYESMDMRLFVDAYASANLNMPKPQSNRNVYRAYDTTNGFALSWAGFDAAYDPAPVGATVSLRFGPSAETYAASCFSSDQERNPCDADVGLQFVKQAFASDADNLSDHVERQIQPWLAAFEVRDDGLRPSQQAPIVASNSGRRKLARQRGRELIVGCAHRHRAHTARRRADRGFDSRAAGRR